MLDHALDSADPRDVLQYMHDLRQAHNLRIRTLEVRYRFKEFRNYEPVPEHVRPNMTDIPLRFELEKQGEFGQSAQKWYSSEAPVAAEQRPGTLRRFQSAFDGTRYYERTIDEAPRFASITEPGRIRPGTPDPRDVAEWTPPSEFVKRLGNEITVSEPARTHRNGHNCIELRVTLLGEPYAQMTALYDADRLLVPVACETQRVDGSRIRQHSIDYVELTVDGEQVFFPVHVESTNYYYGQVIAHHELHVDPNSIRINQPIPDSRFIIAPEPGDLIQTAAP